MSAELYNNFVYPIAFGVLFLLLELGKYQQKVRSFYLLRLAAILATVLVLVITKIEHPTLIIFLLVIGVVLLIFYFFNKKRVHFLALSLGILSNNLCQILNGNSMPLFDSLQLELVNKAGVVLPFLGDWIRFSFRASTYSPGDILIFLFYIVATLEFIGYTICWLFKNIPAKLRL